MENSATYPEHEKLKQINDTTQAIGDFIENHLLQKYTLR